LLLGLTHAPLLQQPLGHVAELQGGDAHTPALQICPVPHVWHGTPPSPQACSLGGSLQLVELTQQPAAQLAGPQSWTGVTQPFAHWAPTLHGAHCSPPVPQLPVVCCAGATHAVPLQHPFGQLCLPQLG
jgi:hypothetical protein